MVLWARDVAVVGEGVVELLHDRQYSDCRRQAHGQGHTACAFPSRLLEELHSKEVLAELTADNASAGQQVSNMAVDASVRV
jgi:hypothetical protein